MPASGLASLALWVATFFAPAPVAGTEQVIAPALRLEVTVQGEDMGAAAAPIGRDTLAVATGETVPAPERHDSYATIGNLLRGVGVAITGGRCIATGSASRLARPTRACCAAVTSCSTGPPLRAGG